MGDTEDYACHASQVSMTTRPPGLRLFSALIRMQVVRTDVGGTGGVLCVKGIQILDRMRPQHLQ